MTLPAGSYLGQVGVFAPLMGLSAADVHNVAKARALGDAGLASRGVAGLSGVDFGTVMCAAGTAGSGLYTGGTGTWGGGNVALGIDTGFTFLQATACTPSAPATAPPPTPPAAPAPGYPAPSIVYMPAPQQQAPLLQSRQGIDQNTLLIIGGLVAAAIVAVIILK